MKIILRYFLLLQITVHYPSGKCTTLVRSQVNQNIFKAICKSKDSDKVIVDNLTSSNPMEIVRGAAKIIKSECKDIYKRGSGSLLQKTDHDSMLSFTWERFDEEIKIKCPGLNVIIGAITSDIPPSVSSKQYRNMMVTAAVGLHGRNQEMSCVHHLIGFIMAHGGCTQRVRICFSLDLTCI